MEARLTVNAAIRMLTKHAFVDEAKRENEISSIKHPSMMMMTKDSAQFTFWPLSVTAVSFFPTSHDHQLYEVSTR